MMEHIASEFTMMWQDLRNLRNETLISQETIGDLLKKYKPTLITCWNLLGWKVEDGMNDLSDRIVPLGRGAPKEKWISAKGVNGSSTYRLLPDRITLVREGIPENGRVMEVVHDGYAIRIQWMDSLVNHPAWTPISRKMCIDQEESINRIVWSLDPLGPARTEK